MDKRRLTALLSLGLVGAVVVGLVATSGNDDSSTSIAAPAAAESDVAPASPSDDATTDATTSEATTPETSSAPLDTSVGDEGAADEPVVTEPVVTEAPAPPATLDPNTPDLPDRGPHPEFFPVQEWLQTDATSFDAFDGKVVALQFWTFGCSNCQATWPHMRDLYEKYAGDDFEIVGVHAPEFDFERDVDEVAAQAEENGLTWPIAIDNEKLNFRSWQERRFWPRMILIDSDGHVRYDHIGEGAYDEIDAAVGALIAEGKA